MSLFGRYTCTYCGAYADGMDHIVPVYWTGVQRKGNTKEGTVPCCRYCNSQLGAKPLFTIAERAWHLVTSFEKRYAKELAVPHWSREELAEVSPRMEAYIRNSMETRTLLQAARKRMLQAACGDFTIEDVWQSIERLESD